MPTAQAFGPDGNLYVLTAGLMGATAIHQVDGSSGELLGTFAQHESIHAYGHLLFTPPS